MEECSGQQYALQVAVQTMKERCLQLQQRLSIVEAENMNLRVKHHVEDMQTNQKTNKSEIQQLHEKIAQLTKQKSQLTHNVLMVATENRHLWNRLSKLTQDNKTLGKHLTKINETLNQSVVQPTPTPLQTTLIRSKTFTHEAPPKIVKKTDDNFADTSLEDISLKIINSIVQEKYELEKQCAQMTEMQSSDLMLTNSIGFTYPSDEIDECTVGEIAENMEKLIYMKDALIEQREKLKINLQTLKTITESGILCKNCKLDSQATNKSTELKTDSNIIKSLPNKDETENICPICDKLFIKANISELVKHVGEHFIAEEDGFELNP